MAYSIQILDSSRNFKALVKVTPALNKEGIWLEYGNKLSDWGVCRFRVGTKDPLLVSEGDILKPWQYHVRIKRDNATVWQGVIVKNPHRTKNYIEVEARTYLYVLSRALINHDTTGDVNYRTFKSGFMSTIIPTLITECKTNVGTPLSGLTVGTVEDPNFPADYRDTSGTALSGTWQWKDTFQIKFDWRDLLYVIRAFGVYGVCDFEVTNDFVFNFKSYIGNRQPQLVFTYGNRGNVENYDVGSNGDSMANDIVGIAADNDFNVLHVWQSDQASINTYGKIQAVAAYADVKNTNLLGTRLKEELTQSSTPENDIRLVLNEKAYPLGQFGIGDTVTVNIQDHVISVNRPMRVVGTNVKVHETGKEEISVSLNVPRDTQ